MPPFDPRTGAPTPSPAPSYLPVSPASPVGHSPYIPNATPPAAVAPAVVAPTAPAAVAPPGAPAAVADGTAGGYAEINYFGQPITIPDAERGRQLMQVGYDIEQQQVQMAAREQAMAGREGELALLDRFRSYAARDPQGARFIDELVDGSAQVPTEQVASVESGDLPTAPDPQLRQLRNDIAALQGAFQEQSAVTSRDRLEREVETALGEWPALQDPAARDLGRDMLLALKSKNPRANVRQLAGSVAHKLQAFQSKTATSALEHAQQRTADVTVPPSAGSPGLIAAVPAQQTEEQVRTYAAHKAGGLKQHLKAIARSQGISGADWRPNVTPPAI